MRFCSLGDMSDVLSQSLGAGNGNFRSRLPVSAGNGNIRSRLPVNPRSFSETVPDCEPGNEKRTLHLMK